MARQRLHPSPRRYRPGMAPTLRFSVAHDFRSPPGSEVTLPEVYAQVMDQVALVDQLGFDLVWFKISCRPSRRSDRPFRKAGSSAMSSTASQS